MIRKGLAIGVILLFIGLCVVPSTAIQEFKETKLPVVLDGNTLYVGGNGPNNYTRIQDALDNASPSDTVYVFNGTYKEHIVITTSIFLIGENKYTTIIDGNNSGSTIRIHWWNVHIQGFTIQNSGNQGDRDAGIRLGGYTYTPKKCSIKDNIFRDNCDAIWICDASDSIISDNIISNNRHAGIYSNSALNHNNISNNYIENNSNQGIFLFSSKYNRIFDNIINQHNGGIVLQESYGNQIYDNIISNASTGILITNSDNELFGNTIINNDLGIHLFPLVRNIKIYHNSFLNNSQDASDISQNDWDDGPLSGGNYWDDYEGVDNDGDGIGDSPYNVGDGRNIDEYPLMNVYKSQRGIHFNIKTSLLKIRFYIENKADESIENIQWKIFGRIILLNNRQSGVIPFLNENETIMIESKGIIGLGIISVLVFTENWRWVEYGIVLGPLLLINNK